MAMSLRRNSNGLLSHLKSLINLQRFNHTFIEGRLQTRLYRKMDSDYVASGESIDVSKWKEVNASRFGITRDMISLPARIVLKILRNEGFDAYLVGGCVRDLILNRIPKDFDVITTATLQQIKKKFYHAMIVGRRFPICRVHVKGSVIEVSSFETVAHNDTKRKEVPFFRMPYGCKEKDFLRWKNCLHRDFTINSLFFDPFTNKIFDYTNGLEDLRSLKLQTLISAQVSFKEDCARILRALRIAARLGLSLSRGIEKAIFNLSPSVERLDKSRTMMEVNYMLSYGAAEPSLCFLWKFQLLKILLPFQAAYLDQQTSKQSSQSSSMLMKLFFHLDKLVACDRPSDCSLWVGLLAFHLALVNNPQDALVIWAFGSVLYHGEWKEGVKFVRERAEEYVNFVPEILDYCECKSDEELAEQVTELASLVLDSVAALTETKSLSEAMSRYPSLPCSGLVFIPRKTGQGVTEVFKVLMNDIKSYQHRRGTFDINYCMLGDGHISEIRFVLGKIILNTMSDGIVQKREPIEAEKSHSQPEGTKEDGDVALSDLIKHSLSKRDKRRVPSTSKPELQQQTVKKQKLLLKGSNLSQHEVTLNIHQLVEQDEGKQTSQKHKWVESSCLEETMQEKETCPLQQHNWVDKREEAVASEKCNDPASRHLKMAEKETCSISSEDIDAEKHVKQETIPEKKGLHSSPRQRLVNNKNQSLLSSLFK
ncbi:Poly(A) polymerase [Quillaja saponaria]|uniref:Poly(A) polymerase n=1 Tax=Quillaja saponaria TaxID=32244 RepID=A0AAD7P6I5_QUISA|nr:Poly(A) polymerase [Quillaja saponaria]